MLFTVITAEQCRKKYEKAEDKSQMLQILADLTACSKKEMANFLQCDIKKNNKHGGKKPTISRYYEKLYSDGYTDKEIAGILDVTVTAVRNWRNRNNLEPNHQVDF